MLTPNEWLYLILSIITVGFVFGKILDFLNYKSQKKVLPDEFKAFYDQEQYSKSVSYHQTLSRFGFITDTFSFILILLILLTGFAGTIDQYLRGLTDNNVVLSLAFFGTLFIASDLLSLPFQIYSTFVIEEKYGFNKTTIKTFFSDKLKSYILTALVGGGILAILIYLIIEIGPNFWIWFWMVSASIILLLNTFYASWVVPLFNKLTPLEEGELKEAILDYSKRVDFPLDNIYVMDGSKRSSKANAYFSGMGKKKKIVLYDTLINNHTTDELVSVLAHEVGHFKKKHIVSGLMFSVLQIGLMLFILSIFVFDENLSLALGGSQLAIHLNLFAFGILYSPVSGIMGIVMNMLSRKNEYEADAFAAKTYKGEPLIAALKKLSANNLSNLFPHELYVFFHYSHPPLIKRINAIAKDN